MRVKSEVAAVVVLSAIGLSLASLALARISGHNGTPAPLPERCPAHHRRSPPEARR